MLSGSPDGMAWHAVRVPHRRSHRSSTAFLIALTAVLALGSSCQTEVDTASDGVEGRPLSAPAHRVAWWQGLKVGMFIHWGPWSQTQRGSIWDMASPTVTADQRASFAQLAQTFPPKRFDAKPWARLAREAGMQYAVFTTKHHDGYANFPHAATKPSRKGDSQDGSVPDVTAAFVNAFRDAGMGVGLYYSHVDWQHPDGAWHPQHPAYVPGLIRTQPQRWKSFVAFERRQLDGLITRYGPIDILWFDLEWPTDAHDDMRSLYSAMRQRNPALLINDRGDASSADFVTPEQHIPDLPPGRPWESCITISEGAGFWYKGTSARYKSGRRLAELVAEAAAKGGNILLNVGPTAAGEIPAGEQQSLRELGAWLTTHGAAVYGTEPAQIDPAPDWGFVTANGHRLFVFVSRWPHGEDTSITLPLEHPPQRASWLAGGTGIPVTVAAEGTVVLELPPTPPPSLLPVAVLEMTDATMPRHRVGPTQEDVRAWLQALPAGEGFERLGDDQLLHALPRASEVTHVAWEQEQVIAFGLTSDHWTMATSPAVLVASNTTDEARRLVVTLASYAPGDTFPVMVNVQGAPGNHDGLPATVALSDHSEQQFVLPPIPAGARRAFAFSANKSFVPGAHDPRSLGVRVDLRAEVSASAIEDDATWTDERLRDPTFLAKAFDTTDPTKRRAIPGGGEAVVLGITDDGWTLGHRPAVVLVRATSAVEARQPVRLRFASYAPDTPVTISVRTHGVADTVRVPQPGEIFYTLPALQPTTAVRAYIVSVDKTFVPGGADQRSLGVRITLP